MKQRRKLFDSLLQGFGLGEVSLDDVVAKLGAPARKLAEGKVTVLEYEKPAKNAIGSFAKVQFICFDELLLNVSYVEPSPKVTRKSLHAALGEPDEAPEDDEDEEDGLSEVFEVDVDAEPMLSFAAHYDDDENLEALSLCAEISEDLLDEDGEGDADEGDDAGEGDADEGDADDEASDPGDTNQAGGFHG